MTNLELAKQFIAEMHYGPYETAAGIESFAEWLDKRAAEPAGDVARETRRKMTLDLYKAMETHESLDTLRASLLLGEFGDELRAARTRG